jgi:hypothetical protein
MLVDKDCWERGCACYNPNIDTDAVNLDKTGWIRAIDEELVAAHLNVASINDSYDVAKYKLNSLINWHIAVATDPATNGGYSLQKVNWEAIAEQLSLEVSMLRAALIGVTK